MFKTQKSKDGIWYGAYHPVFMVKEINSTGILKIDNQFMTNADVPTIALKVIDKNYKDKYQIDKSKGFRVYTDKDNLTIYDNIFEEKNWVYKK
jgi:hypothetical protein